MRGDPERPWIILCHGLGTNRADLLEIAAGLYQAGFNLFLMDFRGHGESAGRFTSFGWREQRDLEGALAFLGGQPDIPPRPYGIYGISMGASVAMMVAARDERLGAVAVDSPYTELRTSIKRHLKLMLPILPWAPFGWFCEITYRLWFGAWPAEVSPQARIASLAPRPLLIIQGDQDVRMLPEEARQLHAAAGEPKELWVISGAGHLEGYAVDPERYIGRLSDFFERGLEQGP